ncbi:MAG TPA: hypothetical protein VG326_20185 [Tepidisphaeraceae bacterium]|jgi:hypothetical protein|nr:hypothetical protein [Tepidisphaeraceae bacterium]
MANIVQVKLLCLNQKDASNIVDILLPFGVFRPAKFRDDYIFGGRDENSAPLDIALNPSRKPLAIVRITAQLPNISLSGTSASTIRVVSSYRLVSP